uniref:Protein kinase C n=1 Tax=Neobodo designis TaxID=312471 RepID=A0A7S1LLC1_NEODS|mmetsp:Transcript_243/g.953  ORF Transcript_243/g.953 Transcript_243/m.953 type:complete len:474 (+) Transcript_243:29-1450(+)
MSSSLEQTLICCQPFKEGASTIVCIGCFKLLAFPSGAKRIKCGACGTITDGIKIRCTACNVGMRVALNVTQVRCVKCQYTFKPQATLKIKPPAWVHERKGNLELPLRVIIDQSVSRATVREKTVVVAPHQPLRASTVQWEEDFGADFRSVGFFKGSHQLDTTMTPMVLELQPGDVIEVQRVHSSSRSGHEFVIAQFGTPTNCSYCKEFIWGVYHQGRKCAKCKLPVHHRCADKVTAMCEADRRQLFGIVNFNESDDEAEADEVVIAVVVSDEDKVAFSSCVEEKKEPECDPNFMQSLERLSNFTDQQIQDMWANYDADGSGTLERDEIKKLMGDLVGAAGGKWGAGEDNSEEAVDRVIARMDQNHDGEVSWEEFWYFFKAQQDSKFLDQFAGLTTLTNDQLYELWYHYDADSSGSLEVDEVMQLLSDVAGKNGAALDKNRAQLASLLSADAKITWETFYTSIVPIIKASLKAA